MGFYSFKKANGHIDKQLTCAVILFEFLVHVTKMHPSFLIECVWFSNISEEELILVAHDTYGPPRSVFGRGQDSSNISPINVLLALL